MTRRNIISAVLVGLMLVLFVGCEADDPTTQGAGDSDSDSDSDTDADTDSDSDSDGDTPRPTDPPEDMPQVPVCMKECGNVNDCVEFGASPLEKAANWECNDGICIHRGCTDDANCQEAFPASNYKCSGEGECLRACTTEADCVRLDLFPGDDDMDENNYLCDGGMCHYLGCLTSQECGVAYGVTSVCVDKYNSGVKGCSEKCEGEGVVEKCVEDHDDPAYDDDNYQCVLQSCYYTGCNDDDECGDNMRCVKLTK